MYCSNCGTYNDDQAFFCSNCGNPFQNTSVVSNDSPRISEPPSSDYLSSFRTSWSKTVSSVFALILFTLFSVYVFLNTREILLTLDNLLDNNRSKLDNDASTIFDLFRYALTYYFAKPIRYIVFYYAFLDTLTGIGLWMTFYNGRSPDLTSISTKGITLIRVRFIIEGIPYYLLFFVYIFYCVFNLDFLLSRETFISFLVIAAILLCVILYNRRWISFLTSVRTSISTFSPDPSSALFLAVIQFISGAFKAISLLSDELSVLTVCNCALPILLGVFLLNYRSAMINLKSIQPYSPYIDGQPFQYANPTGPEFDSSPINNYDPMSVPRTDAPHLQGNSYSMYDQQT